MAGPDGGVDAALGAGPPPAEVAHDVVGRHVTGQQAQRVGAAALGGGFRVVDHVAAVDGQFPLADPFGVLRAGFGELSGDATDPDHRLAGDQLQRPGEQVEHGRLAGDVSGGALQGILGAVPGLHDECLAGGDLGQGAAQGAYVLGADQGGAARQVGAHPAHLGRVVPLGLLRGDLQFDVD